MTVRTWMRIRDRLEVLHVVPEIIRLNALHELGRRVVHSRSAVARRYRARVARPAHGHSRGDTMWRPICTTLFGALTLFQTLLARALHCQPRPQGGA